jgi:large subunit ribosomal protein L5
MSKVFNLKKKYDEEVKSGLLKKFDYLSVMSIPKIEKIVINRGLGEAVSNSKVVELTVDQFIRISGQKPVTTKAKKSISNFKVREGQVIGCKVTLRGKKMYDFITKLINISIPKIRDFRGLPKNSFDGRGNYTLGLKEDGIFPEILIDNIDRPRGFDISIVTNTDNDKESFALLELLGFPFRKN